MFDKGQYIVVGSGKSARLARFTRYQDDEHIYGFACFHHGCTSARFKAREARSATPEDIAIGDPYGLMGYHRFDSECPVFDPEVCYSYCSHRLKG